MSQKWQVANVWEFAQKNNLCPLSHNSTSILSVQASSLILTKLILVLHQVHFYSSASMTYRAQVFDMLRHLLFSVKWEMFKQNRYKDALSPGHPTIHIYLQYVFTIKCNSGKWRWIEVGATVKIQLPFISIYYYKKENNEHTDLPQDWTILIKSRNNHQFYENTRIYTYIRLIKYFKYDV